MYHKGSKLIYSPRAPLHLSSKDVEEVEKELVKELDDREFFHCVPAPKEEITSLVIYEDRKEADYFLGRKKSHAECLHLAAQEFIQGIGIRKGIL